MSLELEKKNPELTKITEKVVYITVDANVLAKPNAAIEADGDNGSGGATVTSVSKAIKFKCSTQGSGSMTSRFDNTSLAGIADCGVAEGADSTATTTSR